jgi:hypothetical protein
MEVSDLSGAAKQLSDLVLALEFPRRPSCWIGHCELMSRELNILNNLAQGTMSDSQESETAATGSHTRIAPAVRFLLLLVSSRAHGIFGSVKSCLLPKVQSYVVVMSNVIAQTHRQDLELLGKGGVNSTSGGRGLSWNPETL